VGEPIAVYGPWGCGRCRQCRASAENDCERAAELPYHGGGVGLSGGMAEYMLVPSARLLFALEEAAVAYERMRAGTLTGRAVIVPATH